MTDHCVSQGEGAGSTSLTLLARVRAGDREAWERFVFLYGPLVYRWCRRLGLGDDAARDVSQDVFRTVYESIGGFQRGQREASFRGWLKRITYTRFVDHSRRVPPGATGAGGSAAQAVLLGVADPREEGEEESEMSRPEDENFLTRRAIDMVLNARTEKKREAFLRLFRGERPTDVALDLGMTVNDVYLNKSRILKDLREILSDSPET